MKRGSNLMLCRLRIEGSNPSIPTKDFASTWVCGGTGIHEALKFKAASKGRLYYFNDLSQLVYSCPNF